MAVRKLALLVSFLASANTTACAQLPHQRIAALESVQTPRLPPTTSVNLDDLAQTPGSTAAAPANTNNVYINSPLPFRRMVPQDGPNLIAPLDSFRALPAVRNVTLDGHRGSSSDQGTCPQFNQSCGTICFDISVEHCCAFSIPNAEWVCNTMFEDCVKDGCCSKGFTQCGRLGCMNPYTDQCCEGEKLICHVEGECNLQMKKCCGKGMKACTTGCFDPDKHHCCVRKGQGDSPVEELGLCENNQECCGRGCCDKGTMRCQNDGDRWMCVPKPPGTANTTVESSTSPETSATSEPTDTSIVMETTTTTDIQSSSETPTETASATQSKVVNAGARIRGLVDDERELFGFRILTGYALIIVFFF